MTITITYPTGTVRRWPGVPQPLVNKLITEISRMNDESPLTTLRIEVTE